MYVKWTGDLQGRGTKVIVHPLCISFARQQICRKVFWEFGGVGGEKSFGIERELSVITSNYSPISRSIYL